MKARLILYYLICFMQIASPLYAAGTMVVSIDNPQYISEGRKGPCKIIIDWTSTSGGAVSGNIASTFTASKQDYEPPLTAIKGRLNWTQLIPGASGDLTTTLPTDAYDVTIKDAYGHDILDGNGANMSGTVSNLLVESTGNRRIDSELTLAIANAGSATTGRIIIMLGE
jgi:hypothetical protein